MFRYSTAKRQEKTTGSYSVLSAPFSSLLVAALTRLLYWAGPCNVIASSSFAKLLETFGLVLFYVFLLVFIWFLFSPLFLFYFLNVF